VEGILNAAGFEETANEPLERALFAWMERNQIR
jgi:hypothetical protein